MSEKIESSNSQGNSPAPQEQTSTETINAPEVINVEQVLNIDDLKDNSVVILKFKEFHPRVMQTIQVLAQRYGKQLQEKNVSVLLMSPDDKVETLDETEMNRLGWKRQGLIIT